ncbi:ATP-binding protein [Actinoplanes sp. NPDC051494]|uniref:ATP-binding protein n=1 Tax=Actinoplanes sp. NPDC051494 TaxID=3363907 RepID=UPI0037B19062
MRITTLGPLAVDGQPVRGERLATVIRELVGARGHAVSTVALAGAVWQGDPPDDTTGAVQALVSRVRRLGVPVVAVPGGYRVPAERVESDIVAARALADRARAALTGGDPDAARRAADEARALFPELPDLADGDRARLFGDVTALRAEAALAGAGPFGEDDLRRLVARTPPDEPAAALLVRILAAQGRDAEALDVVERLRAELADRYGTDPSPVITDVHLALLRGELAAARPRRHARSALPASWRRPGTTMVGRERDLAAVTAALADAPLVTVVASGGSGKTRLAAEVAHRTAGTVRVVELAGLRTPGEVLPAVLAVLGGVEPGPVITPGRRVLSPRERLRAVAPEVDGLLVLDNCEHVLDEAASVVADLLAAAPDVAVLATSRAPLGLAGELVHRLPALPDTEALALLDTRARAGGAVPTWDDERALRLCRRLDNLPLALELAAARLRHMPIDDVIIGLGDRFGLLDDALRGLPDRHASLWAMVDWSRELLAPAEQDLLQRLAVIPAPFTAATAAAVAGAPDVRQGLALLVEQSLLVLADGAGGPPRYRMLETVREYGEARLTDRSPAMTGLVLWARNLAAGLAGTFVGPHQLETIATAAREQENLLGALRWTLSHDDEPASVDLAAALFHLWTIRGLHAEVAAWSRQLMHADDPMARLRSAVAHGRASGAPLPDADRLAWVLLLIVTNSGIAGPLRPSALAGRALRTLLAERGTELSARHVALATVVPHLNNFQSPETRVRVERLIAHDDPYVHGFGHFARAALLESSRPHEGFTEDAERAYASFEAAGDQWGMGITAQALGNSAALRGSQAAVEWLIRSVRHMELVGASQDAQSMRVLLDIQHALNGDAEAERRLRDLATLDRAETWDQAQAALGLGHLAWQREQWDLALACADDVTSATDVFTATPPLPGVVFRVAAAILQLAVAGRQPAPGAEAKAAGLLRGARREMVSGHDSAIIGSWAIAGAWLARHRGDDDVARELWRLGMRLGANFSTMFPPGEATRMAAALETEGHRTEDHRTEDHRPGHPDNPSARIHELMRGLL